MITIPGLCGLEMLRTGSLVAALIIAGSAQAEAPVNMASAMGLEFGPRTTIVSGPLAADGLPDYVEALNRLASEGVPTADNFWALAWPAIGNAERLTPEYIAAVSKRLQVEISLEPRLIDLAKLEGATGAAATTLFEQMATTLEGPWKRSDFPAVVRWLEANEAPLSQIEDASRRTRAYAPLVSSDSPPMVMTILLPHVQASRNITRLLISRAMLRLGEKEFEKSWNDLLTAGRIARHVDSGPFYVDRMVGVSLRSMIQIPLAQWLSRVRLPADKLEARWQELAPLLDMRSLADAVESERLAHADVTLLLASGKLPLRSLDGRVPHMSVLMGSTWAERINATLLQKSEAVLERAVIASADVNATLRYGNEVYDQIEAAMRPETHAERAPRVEAIRKQIKANREALTGAKDVLADLLLASAEDPSLIPGKWLVSTLVPSMVSLERAQTDSQARTATLELAFRLQIAAERNGRIPASIEDIEGEGPRLPVDPYTGKPLLMRSDERGIVISSVGPNGKDEQGRRNDEQPGADDLRTILVVP